MSDRSALARSTVVLGLTAILLAPIPAHAAGPDCRLLQYSFQPDCFLRGNGTPAACRFDVSQPDFGPQIAVWLETAGGSFVDTLMVTNAVALYGIGNRPGTWDFRSGPRYPYGPRPMALPVWAHRRSVTYPTVGMGDGHDDLIASHEAVSSPEPYFCRPMTPAETVDAITCASGTFRSGKGVFDATRPQSFYPPRGDLVDWGNICVPHISIAGQACDYGDARQFGLINDLDTIATATPPYDQTFSTIWPIPASVADGNYVLMVEVAKEFDANSSYTHPSFLTPYEVQYYGQYGLDGNVGQPSVVYRLPFQLASGAAIPAVATTAPAGYGDWTGNAGTLSPMDGTISDAPGRGAGRLLVTDGPGGPGRVHLVGPACVSVDCSIVSPPETPRMDEPTATQDPDDTVFQFRQASDDGRPVLGYDIRYEPYDQTQLDESSFSRWTPAPAPSVGPPGETTTVQLSGLTPDVGYAVGLRALGACGWSAPGFIRLRVGTRKVTRLSGCVVATAAYGSDMDPDVVILRRQRDWVARRSATGRLVALLYSQSAPPLAAMVGRSDAARAAVRSILRPLVLLNRGFVGRFAGAPPPPGPPQRQGTMGEKLADRPLAN